MRRESAPQGGECRNHLLFPAQNARQEYGVLLAGDVSTLTIYRDGQQQEVSVTWGAVPANQQTDTGSQQQDSNSGNSNGSDNYGNYYTDPWDIFNYYFGSRR